MLKAGAVAGAAAITLPALMPARALGRDGAAPASETVRVGIIGCGGRSRDALSAGSADEGLSCRRASAIARSRVPKDWPKSVPTARTGASTMISAR